jgi:hypothetical protein
MAESIANPALGANTPSIDVAAIIKTVTEQVTAALAPKLKELEANVGVVADTLKKLPPAGFDPKVEKTAVEVTGPLTPEAVEKLAADAIAKVLKSREDETAKIAQANDARKAKIDELVKTKLGGKAELASLLTGDGDALAAQADAVAKLLRPADFGGAQKDGGTPPASGAAPAFPNLPKGLAEYAATATPKAGDK